MLCKYNNEAMTLIVALHEMLGHGTGKLFIKNAETGDLNFPEDHKSPFSDKLAKDTAYLSNETWTQRFGKLHSGYEECRADSVALFLSNYEEPFEIFYPEMKDQWDDIHYTIWLEMMYQAIKALRMYNIE